jgi:fibro-slime domain-containing protein
MRASSSVSVFPISFATALLGLLIPACNPGSNGTVGSAGGSGSAGGGAGGSSFTLTGVSFGGASSSSNGGAGGSTAAPAWPPAGYVNVTNVSYGAYALGPLLSTLTASTGGQSGSGGGGGSSGACAGLFGVVRDMKMGNLPGGHPDFQVPTPGDDRGIVTDTLGSDGKPVYAHPGATTPTTSGQANFDQWYRDVDGVNMSYVLGLHFVQNGNVVTFAAALGNAGAAAPDSYYFPLDGQGWNDEALAADGKQHNFSFTTEIHTSFTYNGGETFTFQGDDDVWVYINNHRAIDLGGIHKQETQTVNLDAQAATLGISTGNSYDLAVFNAERHTTQSNFRIDTTLVFTDCGQIGGVIF